MNIIEEHEIDFVVFEGDLTPTQMQNLENTLEVKVLDRTAVILDVFARRANSKEGKLQVELAQMQYILPRLVGYGNKLSRLGGGIGTRGPGETKLEVDRRRIRKKISDLKKEIKNIKKHRQLHRQRRQEKNSFVVSLVGYTNAGKSSLLNTLAGTQHNQAYTEDKLFATLDPATRKLNSAKGTDNPVLITDTVGFIRNLPDQVRTAFQATLEEIFEADLLLHVVDINHPDYERQIEIVRDTLREMEIDLQKEIIVFNKIDLLEPAQINFESLRKNYPGCQFVSALNQQGVEDLRHLIMNYNTKNYQTVTFYVPYTDNSFLSTLYREAEVLETADYNGDSLMLKARVKPDFVKQYYTYTQPRAAVHKH